MTSDVKGQGPKWHDQQSAGEERPLGGVGGEVLVFPILPVAKHLGLSVLVTFCTWPAVPTLPLPDAALQSRGECGAVM